MRMFGLKWSSLSLYRWKIEFKISGVLKSCYLHINTYNATACLDRNGGEGIGEKATRYVRARFYFSCLVKHGRAANKYTWHTIYTAAMYAFGCGILNIKSKDKVLYFNKIGYSFFLRSTFSVSFFCLYAIVRRTQPDSHTHS